ncbi:hypothetical protein ACA30_15870 [Virgibacillus soli]|nr:hypothetical protein ACA30_15870 [Virgibacillus soli]
MPRNYTLAEALMIFIRAKEAEGLRPRTIKQYSEHIEYMLNWLDRDSTSIDISEITPQLIRQYINYLKNDKPRYEGVEGREDGRKGLAINTINIRIRTLRTMCNFWYMEGMSVKNAMANIKPVVGDQTEEVPGLSDDEVDRILASYNERQFAEWRDKVLILLLLDTGLRINEALSLTDEQIDFRLLSVYVPSQIAKNRRMREIPISREVAKKLRELRDESSQYFGETGFIFLSAYGEPLTPDAFRRRLNRRKKRLGMERLSPHMFRHTFCRNYILNGGDIFTLQRIVDHADIKTTRKYIQMDNQHVRYQHNKFSPVKRLFKRY